MHKWKPSNYWACTIEFFHFDNQVLISSGIYIAYQGYAEANSKFLKSYNANKPTSYII